MYIGDDNFFHIALSGARVRDSMATGLAKTWLLVDTEQIIATLVLAASLYFSATGRYRIQKPLKL